MRPPEDLFAPAPGATPLDENECQGLIPSISTRAELNALERDNIHEARVWAMRPKQLKRDDLLSDHFGRELHRLMFRHVWTWAGQYRQTEKTIGLAFPRITEGTRNAYLDSLTQLEHGAYPLAEVAVRLHHRLTVIHPWPNGNGRHARLTADILVAARGEPELTWGRTDLAPAGDVRQRYIAAMKQADQGDFRPIVAFAQG
jgi:Fic-DOC domain mobile mystery protein B